MTFTSLDSCDRCGKYECNCEYLEVLESIDVSLALIAHHMGEPPWYTRLWRALWGTFASSEKK
jgi:hypothetical protein